MKKLFFFYLSAALLLVFLDNKGIVSPLRNVAQNLTIPPKSALFGLKKAADLKGGERIGELEKEVNALRAQHAKMMALEEENERLRQLLGSPLPASWKFTVSRVISKEEDFLITENTEAQKGMSVIIPADPPPASWRGRGGILVGKVYEVRGREVKIMLPSHPDSRIPAFVRNEQGVKTASGIVVGEGRNAKLDQVLTSESLDKGYLVLTNGEGGVPPDLLIGEIEKIAREEGKAWQTASISLSLGSPDYVFFLHFLK